VIALAALITATLCIFSMSANAGTFKTTPCPNNGATGDWQTGNGSAWSLSASCPGGVELHFDTLSEPGENDGVWELTGSPAPIESFTVTMTGSNGSEAGTRAGIKVCSVVRCSQLITLSGTNVTDPETVAITSASGDIPPAATRVVIQGSCIALAGCVPPTSINFADITIVARDDTPPAASIRELRDGSYLIPAAPGVWHNDGIPFADSATDNDSGILRTTLSLAGQSITEDLCGIPTDDFIVGPCGQVAETPLLLTPPFAKQGSNLVTFKAWNPAGLSDTKSITAKLDSIDPSPAIDLAAAGANASGWITSKQATLHWTNGPEVAETGTQSGIAGVELGVERLDTSDFAALPRSDLGFVAAPDSDHVNLNFSSGGQWRAYVKLVDRAGNESEEREVQVKIDLDPPFAPIIAPLPAINRAALANGATINWLKPPAPPSGRCGYSYAFSRTAGFNPGDDPVHPTLADDDDHVTLTPLAVQNLPQGNGYFHIRAFSCAGKPGTIRHEPVLIDLVDPHVTAAPESGWLADNEKVVLHALDGDGGAEQSGIKQIRYTIDGGAVHAVVSASAEIDLPIGSHALNYWSEDNAGNQSTPKSLDIGVDKVAPAVILADTDAADPTLVRAAVMDAESGLATAELQYRAADSGVWQTLGQPLIATGELKESVLEAHLPDDGSLADGSYSLRVVATDRVHHAAVTYVRGDGQPANFNVPIRPRPVATAQIAAAKSKLPPAAALVTEFGTPSSITGALRMPSGAPVVGAEIRILYEREGLSRRPFTVVSTDSNGAFSAAVPPGTSRDFTIRFDGSTTLGPAAAKTSLFVRAHVSIQAPRTARSGKKFWLKGSVATAGVSIPHQGKLISITPLTKGSGTGLERSVYSADGRFAVPMTLRVSKHPVKLRFRAISRVQAGWPFAEGRSSIVTVVVSR
jgi:hypothetical protein